MRDALAVTARNLITFRRVPQLLVFSTIQPVIFVLLFRYVFGGAVSGSLTVPYVDYLMPGIFAQTITESRRRSPGTEIEVLIPDFKGDREALQTVMDARPEVLNHNTETVLRLQRGIRTSANYGRSLALLWRGKQMYPEGLNKSGLIVGMGETREEVLATLADMRAVGIDIVTIGQYLRPTARHRPIHRYVHPDEFAEYKAFGEGIGTPHVESGPLVRSSYHAKESREAVPVTIGARGG